MIERIARALYVCDPYADHRGWEALEAQRRSRYLIMAGVVLRAMLAPAPEQITALMAGPAWAADTDKGAMVQAKLLTNYTTAWHTMIAACIDDKIVAKAS